MHHRNKTAPGLSTLRNRKLSLLHHFQSGPAVILRQCFSTFFLCTAVEIQNMHAVLADVTQSVLEMYHASVLKTEVKSVSEMLVGTAFYLSVWTHSQENTNLKIKYR